MALSRDEVLALDSTALLNFLGRKLGEGQYIDYKIDLTYGAAKVDSLRKDQIREQRDELLKDLTAFANAYGGIVLVGTHEPAKVNSPEEAAVGIEIDPSAFGHRVDQYLSDCVEPRIVGLVRHEIRLPNGRYVFAFWVPASVSRPHRVIGSREFFARHNESSTKMSIQEIRSAVLASVDAAGSARAEIA